MTASVTSLVARLKGLRRQFKSYSSRVIPCASQRLKLRGITVGRASSLESFALESAPKAVSCIVYMSRAVGEWSEPELMSLQEECQTRNKRINVTGRLLFLNGHFIQVIEGPVEILDGLFESISHDPRHTDLHLILNTPTPARSFVEWTMDVVLPNTLPPQEVDGAELLLVSVAAGYGSSGAGRRALGLMRRIGPPSLESGLRAPPRQSRSRLTIQRLLDATQRMLQRNGRIPDSIQSIADDAGVGVKTAYRYFSSVGDLIHIVIKRRQLKNISDFGNKLASAHFASDVELAQFVADEMMSRYFVNSPLTPAVSQIVFERYHAIAYSALWDLAETMIEVRRRCNLPEGDDKLRLRIAMALAATGAAAKMAGLHDMAQLRSRDFREYIVEMVLGALRPSGAD